MLCINREASIYEPKSSLSPPPDWFHHCLVGDAACSWKFTRRSAWKIAWCFILPRMSLWSGSRTSVTWETSYGRLELTLLHLIISREGTLQTSPNHLHDMKIWNTNILHEAQVKDKHSPSLKVCIKPETDWMEDMWLAWWQQASRSPNVSSFSQQTVGWALNSFHMFRFKQDVFPVSTQTWHFVWNVWSRVQTVARCVYGALKFSKKRSKSSTKRRLVRLRGFEFGVAWSRTRCLSYCFDCWDGEELENIRKEAQDEYVAERLREHTVQQKQIKFGLIKGRISYSNTFIRFLTCL